MIETHEPKNGDFAAYVENLSRMPAGASVGGIGLAPGEQSSGESAASRRQQVKALREALKARQQQAAKADAGASPDSLFGRAPPHGTAATTAEAAGQMPPALGALAGGLARLIGRVASVMVFAGVVLIGLSLIDDAPFRPDLGFAIQVLVMGLVARFVSLTIRKKAESAGAG